jgi:hypothetical protein
MHQQLRDYACGIRHIHKGEVGEKEYMGAWSQLSSLIRRTMRKFPSNVTRYMMKNRTKREIRLSQSLDRRINSHTHALLSGSTNNYSEREHKK